MLSGKTEVYHKRENMQNMCKYRTSYMQPIKMTTTKLIVQYYLLE